jgi:hypothetical protein
VVSKYCKLSTFEHEAEVTNRRVSSQEFSVECGVLLLSVREFLGEESQRRPRFIRELLLKDSSYV